MRYSSPRYVLHACTYQSAVRTGFVVLSSENSDAIRDRVESPLHVATSLKPSVRDTKEMDGCFVSLGRLGSLPHLCLLIPPEVRAAC
jgi:hypothetical protein